MNIFFLYMHKINYSEISRQSLILFITLFFITPTHAMEKSFSIDTINFDKQYTLSDAIKDHDINAIKNLLEEKKPE